MHEIRVSVIGKAGIFPRSEGTMGVSGPIF